MTRISFYAALILLLAGTLATEFLFGSWSHRQEQASQLEQGTQRIGTVPEHFGDWQLRDEEPFAPEVVNTLQCPAYLNRHYVNTRTGAKVSATLIVGPAGPMVAHKPEICFTGREFRQVGQTETVTIALDQNREHRFHVANFQRRDLEGTRIACYYGWTNDGAWLAPSNPRLELGGEPSLYKIQIVTQNPVYEEDQQETPVAEQFLKDFLPVITNSVFPELASAE